MGQFRALSQKNWILWKRSFCGNIIEVIVPIIFIAFIVAIRKLVAVDQYSEGSFINNPAFPFYTSTFWGQQSTAAANNASVILKQFNSSNLGCRLGMVVGLVPSGNSFVATLNSKLTALGYTTEEFANDAAVDARVRSAGYGVTSGKFCFGITFTDSTPGTAYKYKLRFNESIQGNTEGPATTLKFMIDQALDLGLYSKTVSSGMLSTTTFVNNLILQAETGSTNDVFKNTMVPIYQEQYEKDNIYTSAKNNVGIIFLLPLLIVYLRQTSVMLSEKQKKIRETMSIMGMNLPVYYVTWFIRYFVTCLVIHLIGSAIISATLPHVKFFVPLVVFIFFDILMIIQSFFIQTFFTRAKLGVVIALLFFLIQYIISFISSNSDNPTLGVNTALSIIPHIGLILSFQTMLYAESIKVNASFRETMNNYTIQTCIISCILNSIFYLFLTWYLEQVFPNEFGSKKHPLFCCFGKNKVTSEYSVQEEKSNNSISPTEDRPDIEEVEAKYKAMETQKKIIRIQNLRKEFNDGDFVAVNNLSLNMYNDNIFVLLGHNGAGKTTTISMLTGMLEPTSGLIQVLGQTQLQKIRQNLGICPQHDTLYEDLTVKEHLQLFGTFRGLSGEQLDEEVKKLITDVNLWQKRDEYSKNLSGGQKRRLSVAMAFAGRSKVIILDEPTSGMDTSARRYIWELLKSYKTDRIILLTTHFMDQADYLGDRIGIMAGGRLICCGSGHYLKNKFGVGYNITFVKKESKSPSAPIVSTVQKHITRAILLSDVSSQITMQLPMDEVKKFPDLFNEIDSKKDTLGITTYGISITTLEQVFLKVGEDTHNVEEVKKQTMHDINYNVAGSPQKFKQSEEVLYAAQNVEPKEAITQNTQSPFFGDEKIERVDGSCMRFLIHLKATILKRLRVIKRDYKSFILELLLPMAIIILALLLMQISFIVDLPEQEVSFTAYAYQSTPLQIPIASSDSTLLNGIQSKLTSKYGAFVSVSKDTASTTASAFDLSFLKTKKLTTKFLPGGLFYNGQSSSGSDTVYAYTTIVNSKIPTSSIFLQTLGAQAYINQINNSNVSISVINSPFPRTSDQLQINNTISGFFGALIFTIALAFKFASIISFIVKEREDKSKHQQIVSGMNILAYWFGNFLYDYVLYLVLAVFSFVMCVILKVDAFTGDAYGSTVCTFIIYGLAYIPLTYIIAYLFKDYGNAQAGYYFFTFVVGGLLSIVVLVLRILGGTANTVGLVLSWIFRIIPSYCFGEILINLGSINLLSVVQLGVGIKYSPWDIKITLAPIIFLIVEFFVYTLFVFLIEAAFNNEDFMRFWTSESKIDETQEIIDSDVLAMREKALNADPQEYEILTKNLRKVYMLDSAKQYKVAVDNLSVAIQKGQVFGLLGVNGAGKTTTFKMLAGEITSTSGDSYFTGMKISDNLRKIRQNLGYCPQFDALIENLTVREQIELFYDLKSLPSEFKDDLVSQKIKEMNLEEYEDKLSGTLSGGNKRKLSVAMAMIGNPNIIFLDEPSTGMDPKARRFMWKIISRIASEKKQSTIILTTHSMQEAEALSTKLGIMVNGNFKCIGTPQHIKSKYGEGYEIEIKVVPCTKDQIKNYMIQNKLENKLAIEEKELSGFLTYLKIDQAAQAEISPKGSGSYIYNQLASTKKIQTFQIIEYILLVNKIQVIKQYMESKFGGCEVIESFQTFIRFKVKATMSVGKMFEVLQNQKTKLEIDSYSIKQATVEQIFNRFAEDGDLSEYMG